ncbi:MAG TPA: UDP-N-acetylglucosamine 2-epimerase (non-hydrolyzing) [Terriglobia bacterium]|nr:UDP-N-acetylglucosamine 2-epimerase (non-hydrolyzing) [Terriglobia bacterium]
MGDTEIQILPGGKLTSTEETLAGPPAIQVPSSPALGIAPEWRSARHDRLFIRPDIRVLSIFGTRPEAIKVAPVIHKLQATEGVVSRVCVTGQHREMLDQVLDLFGIVPDYDLNLMQRNQSLSVLSAAVLTSLEPILAAVQPDWVLVQGDTTTAAVAALASFYTRVKVGHIEAGLRSHDKWRPFPEEVNRSVARMVADLHFAPTQAARRNLLCEGVPESQVMVTGNTVIDALRSVQTMSWEPNSLGEAGREVLGSGARIILVTAHRRENFGAPLVRICAALRDIAARYGDSIRLFYPVHRNPNVWEPVHQLLGGVPNIILSAPLEYLSLIHLMRHSHVVLTDSGGIQEEAPALGVPALVLREVTERPEAVASGNVRLVGTDPDRIVSEVVRLLDNPGEHRRMAQAVNPYGDGHAAERIARALCGKTVRQYEPGVLQV